MDPLQLLNLKKQYEILALLEPNNSNHQLALKAIDSGFEFEIQTLIEDVSIEPVSMVVCEEVRSILDMFRNLQNSLRENEADEALIKSSLFPGFDGNEETGHYSYALYLLEDKGLWRGLENRENTWNSHHPTLDGYRSMLAEFEGVGGFPYSNEEVERVLAARLHR
ncbi:YfbU family protein [Pseudomonas chlororaphis]|uniref:YfbU family protein n=1 Tax=Pseudomonas chlororaphis TaxID=587753 RepID=UPI00215A9FD7|nr:YfbU family protein [Pseudomonas chlororaphis]UVE47726.1 YfbU family protein [Pseudomonas chlororaphis]